MQKVNGKRTFISRLFGGNEDSRVLHLEPFLEDAAIMEMAVSDGRSNVPEPSATALSANECKIRDACQKTMDYLVRDATIEYKRYVVELRNHLLTIDDKDCTTIICDAEQEFEQTLQNAKDPLKEAYSEMKDRESGLNAFKVMNRLNHRRAKYPESQFYHLGCLGIIVLLEAAFNLPILAEGLPGGYLTAAPIAVIISIVNISLAFLTGIFGFRNIQHVNKYLRLLGGVFSMIYCIAVIALNLIVGHYREVLQTDPIEAMLMAIPHFWNSPFGINDFSSLVLVGIGLLGAVIATYDGYNGIDDKYPGYGSIDRLYRASEMSYSEEKQSVRNRLEQIAGRAMRLLDQKRESAKRKTETCRELLKQKDQIGTHFEPYATHVERTFTRQIKSYREANTAVRRDRNPIHFSTFPGLERGEFASSDGVSITPKSLDEDLEALIRESTEKKAELRQILETKLSLLTCLIENCELSINGRIGTESQGQSQSGYNVAA